jgi:glycosyltransferase involved in cell wall biosynthesis
LSRPGSGLDDVLVVTVRKSFWASPEARAFPHRVYARVFFGHSTNLLNSLVAAVQSLLAVWVRRPRVVVLGSVERLVPWFIRARRLGLLGRARLVVTNQLHLDDRQLRLVDRNIVYSRTWLERQRGELRERSVFVPLPADGDFAAARGGAEERGYVFAGGGAGRDFPTLIEAMRDLDVPLEIVTFSPELLGWAGELPPNCHVDWRMPVQAFLERVASAVLVVVPLRDPESDFGQTTVVQALSLGKAVVTTRSPGVVDYVEDGREGLLVGAGDVEGYRAAIARLLSDGELRRACERNALERAQDFTYSAFCERLAAVCSGLFET